MRGISVYGKVLFPEERQSFHRLKRAMAFEKASIYWNRRIVRMQKTVAVTNGKCSGRVQGATTGDVKRGTYGRRGEEATGKLAIAFAARWRTTQRKSLPLGRRRASVRQVRVKEERRNNKRRLKKIDASRMRRRTR